MGFRFQRRLNLGSGFGFNLGKTGASVSRRTSFGSIGTGGFSLRSGIAGFGYRRSFGRGGRGVRGGGAAVGLAIGLVFGLVMLAVMLVVNLVSILVVLGVNIFLFLFKVLWLVLVVLLSLIWWSCLTTADFVRYLLGSYSPPAHHAPHIPSVDKGSSPPEKSTFYSPEIPMLPVHGRPRLLRLD